MNNPRCILKTESVWFSDEVREKNGCEISGLSPGRNKLPFAEPGNTVLRAYFGGKIRSSILNMLGLTYVRHLSVCWYPCLEFCGLG